MKYLFNHMVNIKKKIDKAEQVNLFLDFDGTLSNIVNIPRKARISAPVRGILNSFGAVKNKKIIISIISGRELRDVRKRAGIVNAYYAGNHGAQIQGPGIKWEMPCLNEFRPSADKIKKQLKGLKKEIPGIVIEDKKFGLGFHYRAVNHKNVKKAKNMMMNICRPFIDTEKIILKTGKKVIEVRPFQDTDKAMAVERLIKIFRDKHKTNPKNILNIYAGDDKTDIIVFRGLKKKDISVFVGTKRVPEAEYYVRDVSGIRRFLEVIRRSVSGC